MGGTDDGLLDVGSARGAGYHVDGTRHAAWPIDLAQSLPGFLITGVQVFRLQYDDMRIGQEVEGGGIIGARDEDDGARFGCPGKGV